jgi:alanine dehydrogenase
MIIGCPKEIKAFENRVALIPSTVRELVKIGPRILVEKGAGLGSNISDDEYQAAGAEVVANPHEIWERANIICKVKEPLNQEFAYFRENLVIFTFLHLAAEADLCKSLLKKKVTAIAYETIEVNGHLPVLKPMSEVAGRMAPQIGASCLENQFGGKGILLSGVPGVRKGRVVILGAGVVGKNAAKIALGMGADVTILDINSDRLEEIEDIFSGRVHTLHSNAHTIARAVQKADLVIGAVLLAGARAPRLVTKEMVASMEKGSVLIDVAVDQGGCIETVRRTTHDHPTYILDGVVHYGVANMPGAVASTSTLALSHATFPYLKLMAQEGVHNSLKNHLSLRLGLNTINGYISQRAVAETFATEYQDPMKLLS